MSPSPGDAAVAYFGMALLLIMSFLSFTGGNPKTGGILLVLAALAFVAASVLRRGE